MKEKVRSIWASTLNRTLHLSHSAGAGGGDEWDHREQSVREAGMGHIPGREAAMGAVCGGGERTCPA